jgi:hypothetical protein
MQADSLLVLVLKLNGEVAQESQRSWLSLGFLWVQLLRLGEQFDDHDVFNAAEWETWRTVLIATLERLWLPRDTIAAVSKQYYDNHSILFSDQGRDFNQCIVSAEFIANSYHSLDDMLPSWTAIDLAALHSSIEVKVPDAVEEKMTNARAAALRAVGEWGGAHQNMIL